MSIYACIYICMHIWYMSAEVRSAVRFAGVKVGQQQVARSSCTCIYLYVCKIDYIYFV